MIGSNIPSFPSYQQQESFCGWSQIKIKIKINTKGWRFENWKAIDAVIFGEDQGKNQAWTRTGAEEEEKELAGTEV